MLDQISFEITTSRIEDYKVVDILINGRNLRPWLAQAEQAPASTEGQATLAGAYEGLPPLLVLPPRLHFWGRPHADYLHGQHIALFEYAFSGVPGDWTFAARIEVEAQQVRWHGYRQLKRPHWTYPDLPPFHFDRKQYQAALQEAAQAAY